MKKAFIVAGAALLAYWMWSFTYLGGKGEGILRQCGTNQSPITFDPEVCKHVCGPFRRPAKFNLEINSNATDSLRYFVLFVGHARSGSSITGAVLDAHPHVILSHEYFLLRRMAVVPDKYASKSFVFSELYSYQQWKMETRQGVGSKKKGYSLVIKDSYQGRYDQKIRVLGDKAAASTVVLYRKDTERFRDMIHSIESTLGAGVKFIQVCAAWGHVPVRFMM